MFEKINFLTKSYLLQKMTDSRLVSSSSLLSLSAIHSYRGQQSPAFGSHCYWNHCGTLQPHAHPVNNYTDSHKVGVHPHNDSFNVLLQIASQLPRGWRMTLHLPAFAETALRSPCLV